VLEFTPSLAPSSTKVLRPGEKSDDTADVIPFSPFEANETDVKSSKIRHRCMLDVVTRKPPVHDRCQYQINKIKASATTGVPVLPHK
jgi:hypothetical protein